MEFSQDTRVNTPTLTISARGSLVTTESQDTHLTSNLKGSTLHRAMSTITALGYWDIFLDQRKGCLLLPPTGPPTPLPVASGSHPGTNQDQPCLTSEASQQWDAGWYAAGHVEILNEGAALS
jgi:hypothetical protein